MSDVCDSRFAACVLLSAAYAADNLPSAVFDSQRCRSGSCKGAGSRRYHVLDYMKHVFLSIGLVKFFRILPQNFFFVFVLIHKFHSWFLEIFGQMQRRPHIYDTGPPGPAGYRSTLPYYRSTVTSASCAPVISCSAFTLSSI